MQNFDLVDSLSFFPMFLLDAFVYRFCHCPIFIRVQNSIVSRIVILWNALEFFWPLYFHIFDCTYMCWSIRWWEVQDAFPITHVQSIPSNLPVTIQVLKFHIFLQINCDICCSWKLLQWEICPRSFVWLCGWPNKG